jgi:hypothetical protein
MYLEKGQLIRFEILTRETPNSFWKRQILLRGDRGYLRAQRGESYHFEGMLVKKGRGRRTWSNGLQQLENRRYTV